MADTTEGIDVSSATQRFLELEDEGFPLDEVRVLVAKCRKQGPEYVAAVRLELKIMRTLETDVEIGKILEDLEDLEEPIPTPACEPACVPVRKAG